MSRQTMSELTEGEVVWWWIKRVGAVALLLIAAGMYGCPQYQVYSQNLHGQAELARAAQTRMIQIEQAKGEETAATHRANAIKIMGQAAKDFPEYRKQEFIGAFAEALHNGKINQIIYVPTEAGIPITEAGRR